MSFDTVSFLDVSVEVGANVLRPREETELLGREALAILRGLDGAPVIIDMCCGSGNLAIALAVNDPRITVWASDLTDDAVANARHNVSRSQLDQRVSVVQGDMFAALSGKGLDHKANLIIANPPYISTHRLLEGDRAHLLEAEPREAFDGGPYGIALHQRLIAEAPAFLRPGGWLGFEFGAGQDRQIAALLKRSRAYADPVWHSNEAGENRVVFIRTLEESLA